MPRVIKVAPACAVMISTYEFGKAFFQKMNLDREWAESWGLLVWCWVFLSGRRLFTAAHADIIIRTVGTKSPQTEAWGTGRPGFSFVWTQKKRICLHFRDASINTDCDKSGDTPNKLEQQDWILEMLLDHRLCVFESTFYRYLKKRMISVLKGKDTWITPPCTFSDDNNKSWRESHRFNSTTIVLDEDTEPRQWCVWYNIMLDGKPLLRTATASIL